MAKLKRKFDSREHDTTGFELIEEQWYVAALKKSEDKPTKAGDGSYLSLMFQILDGKRKGRTVWTNLNLDNPNPVAVEIAERNFATLVEACGKVTIEDTDELHGIPIQIKVGIEPAQGQYDARNSIKGYKPLDEEFELPEEEEEEEEEEQEEKPKKNGKKKTGKKKVASKKKAKKVEIPEDDEDDEEIPDWLREEEEEPEI